MCLTPCCFVNKLSRPWIFRNLEGVVLPEWIDANGHMNLAYYVVLFDQATDLLYDRAGRRAGVSRRHRQLDVHR